MKNLISFLLFIFCITINGQVNLLSITPTDGSTNVALNTTISIEFDQSIDTSKGFDFFQDFFTNVYDLQAKWFSPDLKTVNLGANLEANKNYYLLVYSAKSLSGDVLENPTVVYFSTDGELSGSTVTGTVSAGANSGLDFSKTLIALSSTPVINGEPMIEAGGFANSSGNFSIPNVDNGVYYPIAANDANGDGELDPSGGDAFAFMDMITIDGDYSGLNFLLSVPDPLSFSSALDEAESLIETVLPPNAILKRINADESDSAGKSGEWEFYFLTDSVNKVTRLRIDQFGYNVENRFDEWEYEHLVEMDELDLLQNSVDLEIFVQNAEAAGGFEFRNQSKPDNLEVSLELILADHRYSYVSHLNPDTSNHIMWAAVYRWYERLGDNDWRMDSEFVRFGDFETGALILTDVKLSDTKIPEHFKLEQNYPNPFNPNTLINYSVPMKKYSLSSTNEQSVKIIIYDVLGNIVTTLLNAKQEAGNYSINFDASEYPSGTYFYQLQTEQYSNTKKMLLLK